MQQNIMYIGIMLCWGWFGTLCGLVIGGQLWWVVWILVLTGGLGLLSRLG